MTFADPRTLLHRGLLAGLPDAPDALARTEAPCGYCGTPTRGRCRGEPACVYSTGCAVERPEAAVWVVYEGWASWALWAGWMRGSAS